MGRTAKYDHNNIISAILVLLNTFGGQFLICALYPLLVIAPSSLYTIYPSLAPRRTSKMVIKNQNGTKQREIVKKITDDLDNGTVNVTTFAGLDSENEHLEIHHGELALYENDDLFFGQLYKTATQLIILQAIRVCINGFSFKRIDSSYSFKLFKCLAINFYSIFRFSVQ